MPRPKKIPEFQEGPQAAENFTRLMRTLVQFPPRVLLSERRETTTVTVEETPKKSPRRKSRKSK
jgi:hypothetical protein